MCPTNPAHRDSPAGFTLLELLLAVALLGVVLSLLFGGFAQLSRTARVLNTEGETRQELRLLAETIVSELAAVQYLKEHAAANGTSGLTGSMRFINSSEFSEVSLHAAVPARFHRQVDPAADPGLHEIGYRVALDDDRETLLLVRREDFYLDNDLRAGGAETPLARNVDTFLIEYLSAPESAENLEDWRESWDSSEDSDNPLPVAIRFRLALKQEDGRVLEETLVRNLGVALDASGGTQP